MAVDDNRTPDSSWGDWPDQIMERARTAVERMDNGAPAEALEILDSMIADLHSRRATLAEVANSLD